MTNSLMETQIPLPENIPKSEQGILIRPRLIPVLRARLLQGLVAGPFLMLPMFSLEEKLIFLVALTAIILLGAWGTYQGVRFVIEPTGLRPLNTGGQHYFCAWDAITKITRPYGFLSPEFCVYYDVDGIPHRLTLWVVGQNQEFVQAIQQYAPTDSPLRQFIKKHLQ